MKRTIIAAMVMAVSVVALGATAMAGEYTTQDGTLTLTTPNDQWMEISDPNTWVTLGNGSDTITILHYRNGDQLPLMSVADNTYVRTYQTVISDQNKVYVVTGKARNEEDYEDVLKAVQSVRVDHEAAKNTEPQENPTYMDFIVEPADAMYWVSAATLNVRPTYSTDQQAIGYLTQGDYIEVTGTVLYNGEDYGWRRINFYGQTGYVAAQWLSATKVEAPAPAVNPATVTAPGPVQQSSGNTLRLRSDTGYMDVVQGADGVYRDDLGIAYEPQGAGQWTDANGNKYHIE